MWSSAILMAIVSSVYCKPEPPRYEPHYFQNSASPYISSQDNHAADGREYNQQTFGDENIRKAPEDKQAKTADNHEHKHIFIHIVPPNFGQFTQPIVDPKASSGQLSAPFLPLHESKIIVLINQPDENPNGLSSHDFQGANQERDYQENHFGTVHDEKLGDFPSRSFEGNFQAGSGYSGMDSQGFNGESEFDHRRPGHDGLISNQKDPGDLKSFHHEGTASERLPENPFENRPPHFNAQNGHDFRQFQNGNADSISDSRKYLPRDNTPEKQNSIESPQYIHKESEQSLREDQEHFREHFLGNIPQLVPYKNFELRPDHSKFSHTQPSDGDSFQVRTTPDEFTHATFKNHKGDTFSNQDYRKDFNEESTRKGSSNVNQEIRLEEESHRNLKEFENLETAHKLPTRKENSIPRPIQFTYQHSDQTPGNDDKKTDHFPQNSYQNKLEFDRQTFNESPSHKFSNRFEGIVPLKNIQRPYPASLNAQFNQGGSIQHTQREIQTNDPDGAETHRGPSESPLEANKQPPFDKSFIHKQSHGGYTLGQRVPNRNNEVIGPQGLAAQESIQRGPINSNTPRISSHRKAGNNRGSRRKIQKESRISSQHHSYSQHRVNDEAVHSEF